MASIAFTFVDSYYEAIQEKIHNLGSDQLVVALSNTAPSVSNTQLSDITQISYTNCSSRNITTSSSSQTGGIYKIVLANLTLSASGGNVGPFRYIVVYNDTATNDELIGFSDHGSSITITDGNEYQINFDQVNGLFRFALKGVI